MSMYKIRRQLGNTLKPANTSGLLLYNDFDVNDVYQAEEAIDSFYVTVF